MGGVFTPGAIHRSGLLIEEIINMSYLTYYKRIRKSIGG